MRSLLRSTLLLVLAALVATTLGSCGKPKSVARKVHEPGGVKVPQETDAPDALTMAAAMVPYDTYGTDAARGIFPRTIRHAMGDTVIAGQPKRIVTLGIGELDTTIRLGVRPVGMTDPGPEGLPSYIDEADVESIASVGPVEAPDLAAIAALRPDLILSNVLRHEALYDQLSQIAPTVFGGHVDVAWRFNADLLADAMGREREAKAITERYKQRVSEAAAALPQPRPRISLVRIMPGTLRIYERTNFPAQVMTDLGINRPRHQNYDQSWTDTTLDNTGAADGDVIFVAATDDESTAIFRDEVAPSDEWHVLRAVKGDRVREVDHRIWIDGQSYGAAFELLDQLVEVFDDKELRAIG